jgi:hypothetical protein
VSHMPETDHADAPYDKRGGSRLLTCSARGLRV